MRKFIVAAIPIVTLILFIAFMLSGGFLKKPLTGNDNIPEAIDDLKNTILNEHWTEAQKKTDNLEHMWKKIVARVQFSSERDEINYFSMNIAQLRGSMLAKDKAGALTALSEAYEHWDQLSN